MPRTRTRLTDRDIAILCFINEFGYCEISHLQKRFSLKPSRSYQIVQRLVRAGFVLHERIFFARPGLFRVSHAGAQHTTLPALKHIPLWKHAHTIALINVYLRLRELYPDAMWISERRLIHDKLAMRVGNRTHIADGLLLLPDNRKIAIEVELSLKGKWRVERIFRNYAAQFSIQEVWYYCPEQLLASLRELGRRMPFIKINSLSEFLYG